MSPADEQTADPDPRPAESSAAVAGTPRKPHFTFVVPAYNEEAELSRTLAALEQAISGVGRCGEIVVVDNASTDRTAEIATSRGHRVVHEEHRQIARARNRGARAARGSVIIFCDADTRPSTELVRAALDRVEQPEVIAGGTLVEFDDPDLGVARYGVSLWNTVSRISGFAAGCFLFCDRRAFAEAGGFDERFYAGEELTLRTRLQKRFPKKRFELLTEFRIETSSRKADSIAQLARFVGVALLFPFAARFRSLCAYWYRR